MNGDQGTRRCFAHAHDAQNLSSLRMFEGPFRLPRLLRSTSRKMLVIQKYNLRPSIYTGVSSIAKHDLSTSPPLVRYVSISCGSALPFVPPQFFSPLLSLFIISLRDRQSVNVSLNKNSKMLLQAVKTQIERGRTCLIRVYTVCHTYRNILDT